MPIRLITFIVTLLVIVTFIGFNIENSSDIRFWFGEKGILTDIPIFVSFFVMYLIGVVSVVPFLIGRTFRRKNKNKSKPEDSVVEEKKAPRKVRVLGKKGKETEADSQAAQESGNSEAETAPEEPVKFGKRKKSSSKDLPQA